MVVLYLSCAGGRDVMGVYEIILLRVQVGTYLVVPCIILFILIL